MLFRSFRFLLIVGFARGVSGGFIEPLTGCGISMLDESDFNGYPSQNHSNLAGRRKPKDNVENIFH